MRRFAGAYVVIAAALLAGGCKEVDHKVPAEKAGPLTLFVASNGNDAWSGKVLEPNAAKTDGPLATLGGARDAIRTIKKKGSLPAGGVTVFIRGGQYELGQTLELSAEDSGTQEAPIRYYAYKGEKVRLIGGKVVTGFKPVTDPSVLSRLDERARGKVLQADLRAQGITDYGDPKGGGLELFYQDEPMTLARWPNEGFVKMVEVLGKTERDVRGTKGCVEGVFRYADDRPKRWAGEKDVWVHGYWFWDWADERQKVQSIDLEQRIVTLVPPHHSYGYRKGQWFYAYNILAELDTPGEWYLDREKGILYFWPPATFGKGTAVVSVLPTFVTMKDTSCVIFRGLTCEAARSTAVTIAGGTQNCVVGCTFRNLGRNAVTISGGSANGVVGCDVYNMAQGGISLGGGERKTLTACGHYALNNHIHHYGRWKPMYSAGISINGVGILVSHNLIHNAPHQAIGFGGNNHIIEFNEIHSVCYESNDAGAMYAGRDWTQRGTIIRYNYMHHICGYEGRGCVGVYLDDMFCGTLIFGNVFYRVPRAAFVGGGRDCIVENNIFVDCVPAVHVDARALGWAHGCSDRWIEEGKAKGTLSGIRYKEPPYSKRYPKLIDILDDDPAAPKGNIIVRNVCAGGKWDEIEKKAQPYVTFQDNLVGGDPHFAQKPGLFDKPGFSGLKNFQLRDDSPMYKLGFKHIPIEEMGLFNDGTRASWPVSHTIRKMIPPPPPPVRPAPKRPVRAGPPPTFTVPRAVGPIAMDGAINPAEWAGADPKKAMVIERGIQHELLQPKSYAWLHHDDQNLYIAILNEVDTKKPLQMGANWGKDDAVEVAVRNPEGGKNAPLFVLRGYPNGRFESSTEAKAPADAARKAGEATKFAAKVIDTGHWTAEYCISLAALGISPAKHAKLAFNLTVRKSAEPLWLMWQGTGGYSWMVENAGFIELK
jgi:hypothetical protein